MPHPVVGGPGFVGASHGKLSGILKSLGPGLLFAGVSIGVSHLVQSTRAGANFGFALVWAIVLVNVFKYPFFEYGPRYAAVTGESLLEGYMRLGKWAMAVFIIMTFGTMFTVEAAVTIVTAGLAAKLFGITDSLLVWSAALLVICSGLLVAGRYALLDRTIKVIITILALSTVVAAVAAIAHGRDIAPDFVPPAIWDVAGVTFLVALMGWMPTAIDISVWHSIWTLERKKQTEHAPSLKQARFDYNLGYIGTGVLALCFVTLGAMTFYGSGEKLSAGAVGFAGQVVAFYTSALGGWSGPVIFIAAFTTMFSTTLGCTDAFPRVLQRTTTLVFPKIMDRGNTFWLYLVWMAVIVAGALLVISVFFNAFKTLIDLATTLSFLTAPLFAYINYRVVTDAHMPEGARPGPVLRVWSWLGMAFLAGFGLLFLYWKFVRPYI